MKSNKVKQFLLKSIRETACKREFFQNPDSDFTRIRKLPFEKVMRLILSMGGGTLDKELLDSFHLSLDAASLSAFVQQRAKISYAAFENLTISVTCSNICCYVAPYTRPVRTVQWEVRGLLPSIYPIAIQKPVSSKCRQNKDVDIEFASCR